MKKICQKCGVEIENGVNGCMVLGDLCYECNGGYPDYSRIPRIIPESTWEEAEYWENLCLSKGEPVD